MPSNCLSRRVRKNRACKALFARSEGDHKNVAWEAGQRNLQFEDIALDAVAFAQANSRTRERQLPIFYTHANLEDGVLCVACCVLCVVGCVFNKFAWSSSENIRKTIQTLKILNIGAAGRCLERPVLNMGAVRWFSLASPKRNGTRARQ